MLRPILIPCILTLSGLPVFAEEYCATLRDMQPYKQETTCVSSVLPAQSGNRYDIRSLMDGSDKTAWCEGVGGHGVGQSIEFTYVESVPIRSIWLSNGYAKSSESFTANSRIKDVTINFWAVGDRAMRSVSFRLPDTMQEVELPLEWTQYEPARLQVVIDDVYPGSRWSDTCVNKIWVDFYM